MIVCLNEINFKGKLYFVLKFECLDLECRILDKRDKLMCKNLVFCENWLKSNVFGYLRFYWYINDIISGILNNINYL